MLKGANNTDAADVARRILGGALEFDALKMRARAEGWVRAYPRDSKADIAHRVIGRSRLKNTALGVATGLPGNPWLALPAGAVDVALGLQLHLNLACLIALIYDREFLEGDSPPYELLIPVLGDAFAHDVFQALRIHEGNLDVSKMITRSAGKKVLRVINAIAVEFVAKLLLRKTATSKLIPVVGGVIGGVWNYRETRAVGERSISHFERKRLS